MKVEKYERTSITVTSGRVYGLIERTDTKMLEEERSGVKRAVVIVRPPKDAEEMEAQNRRLQGFLPRGVFASK